MVDGRWVTVKYDQERRCIVLTCLNCFWRETLTGEPRSVEQIYLLTMAHRCDEHQ